MTPASDTPRSHRSRISVVRHLLRVPHHGHEVLGWLLAWAMILFFVGLIAQWADGWTAVAAMLGVAAIAVAIGTVIDRLT